MSTETKYYELVKASEELPGDLSNDKKYFCKFYMLGNLVSEDMATGAFINSVKHMLKELEGKEVAYCVFNEIEWLRPVNLSDIIRDAKSDGYDAGFNQAMVAEHPDKETYLNNL